MLLGLYQNPYTFRVSNPIFGCYWDKIMPKIKEIYIYICMINIEKYIIK